MKTLNGITLLLASAATLLLSACGNDPKVANEANFEKALNAHYAIMKACLRVGSKPNDKGIIQEFRVDNLRQDKQLTFYNGLASLDLLEAVSYQKDVRTFSGQVTGKSDWIGFKISDEGKAYQRPAELDKGVFSTGAPQLCYGTPQVVAITNFTEPAEVMGVQASSVQYTYKLVDVAPWVKDPIVSSKFKNIADRISNQAIEDDDDLVLTNNGWVHHKDIDN